MRGLSYTRLAQTGWPRVELIGILVVALSALAGTISPLLVASYLTLSVLLGSVQSLASVLLEESAFQRQTDTGVLLGRYILAIWVNLTFRLRAALTRIFC